MPRGTLQAQAYRRVSVNESAVVVWVCKNWEKDSKGNGKNLRLFRHLPPSKSAAYRPLSKGTYRQWVSKTNGVFELPSKHRLFLVGKLS